LRGPQLTSVLGAILRYAAASAAVNHSGWVETNIILFFPVSKIELTKVYQRTKLDASTWMRRGLHFPRGVRRGKWTAIASP
jgi:hypothetical protein